MFYAIYALIALAAIGFIIGIFVGGIESTHHFPANYTPTFIDRIVHNIDEVGAHMRNGFAVALLILFVWMGIKSGMHWRAHIYDGLAAVIGVAVMWRYLSTTKKQRRKTGRWGSKVVLIVGLILTGLALFFQNNADYYIMRAKQVGVTTDKKTKQEWVVTGPDTTVFDPEMLFGGDWERVKAQVESNQNGTPPVRIPVECIKGLNPDVTGYDITCEEGKYTMRAWPLKDHLIGMAAGETKTPEEMLLKRRDHDIKHKEEAAELVAREKGEWVNPLHKSEVVWKIIGIGFLLGLLIWMSTPVRRRAPARTPDPTPTPAAPTAPPVHP